MIQRGVFWFGWVLVAVAAGWLTSRVLLMMEPLPEPQITHSSPPAVFHWPQNLSRVWVAPQRSATPRAVQPSRLPVTVMGAFLSPLPGRSVVVLGYRSQLLTMSEGDELDQGIVLLEIQADQLIFDHRGRTEAVRWQLEESTLSPAQRLDRGDAPASQARRSQRSVVEPVNRSTQPEPPVEEFHLGTRALEDTFGPEFRRSLVQDPLQLMRYVMVAPRQSEGQLQGYELRPGQDASLFERLGLQAGDLVVAVDGVAVTDTAGMMSLHGRLAQAERLEVDIVRDDRPYRFRLDME